MDKTYVAATSTSLAPGLMDHIPGNKNQFDRFRPDVFFDVNIIGAHRT
jgi:hypothetical protein